MTALKPYLPQQTNRAIDPSLESLPNPGSGMCSSTNGAQFAMASPMDTVVFHNGKQSAKLTRQASTPNNALATCYLGPSTQVGNAYIIAVTPGESLCFGYWARCTLDQWRASVNVQMRSADGLISGTTYGGPVQGPFPANTWQWITAGPTVVPAGSPAPTTRIAFLANAFGPLGYVSVGGEVTNFDSYMVIASAVPPAAYFDGDTPGSHWNGTPNQSQSTRAVQTPWGLWNGTTEAPLDVAGQWDGAALLPVDLRDVTVV